MKNKKELNKKHQHFKFSDEDVTHVFNSPSKLAIFVGVFVTIIICVVILVTLDLNKKRQSKQEIQVNLVEEYSSQAGEILNTFLVDRKKDEFLENDFCQQTIDSTASQILNLIVPTDYKEFHLKLVILLDQEMKNCEEKDEKILQELDLSWEELISQL